MNFDDILNVKSGDIEKPADLPQGTYVWKIAKVHRTGASASGEWSWIELPVVPVRAYEEADDVTAEDLAAFGDLRMAQNSIRFMFPTGADKEAERARTIFDMKQFLLETLKVDGDDDSTLKELLAQIPGYEFVARAAHRVDGDRTFVDIKKPQALE